MIKKEYFRKGIVVGVIILFFGAVVFPSISGNILGSLKTIYVDDDWEDDPPNHRWNTIQKGINDAEDGDIVYVYNGTYYENVVIDKKITLEGIDEDEWGNDRNGSIIHGDESGPVVFIHSSDTVITGFTIENSSVSGIKVEDSRGNVIISLNVIQSAHNGIECEDSNDVLITENRISNNLHGIALDYSKRCRIEKNYIENNTHSIWLKDSFLNKIYWNDINNTETADIFLQGGGDTDNEIYDNNFRNRKNKYPRFRNSLNDWHDNYWDEWRGLKGIKNMPPFYIIQGWIISEKIWWLGGPWFQLDPRPRSTPVDIP